MKGPRGGDAVLVKSNESYILMDCGTSKTAPQVIKYLKKQKVQKLNLYISHADADHVGGLKKIAAKFKIENIYMPAKNIAANLHLKRPYQGCKKVSQVYSMVKSVARKKKCQAIDLRRNSTFTIGEAEFQVIGPVESVTDEEYGRIKDLTAKDDRYGKNIAAYVRRKAGAEYVNAMSLSTIISCNNVKYLTMGDTLTIMEKYIARLYDIDADILKMSHHACLSATSNALLKASSPSFVFASSGFSKAHTKIATKRVSDTAHVKALITGDLKRNIVYKVSEEGKIAVSKTK